MTATFAFERYVNGILMAEGVTIERQKNLSSAMRAASKLAARGSNGEVPVLVYCAKTYTEVEVQSLADRDARVRREALEWAAMTAYRVCAETRHVTLGQACEAAILADGGK